VSRFRITIRGEQPPVELRGFVDSPEAVMAISEVIRPWGVLIASQAPDDYSPFGPTPEPACAHESWEADSAGNASKCTDCGAILPPNWADKVAEPPFHAKRSTR